MYVEDTEVKLTASIDLKFDTKELTDKTSEASRLAMRDTVVAIAGDAIAGSRAVTGNNRRSIAAEVSGMGLVETGGDGGAERVVDESKIEGAVYSTSGYGGYLEVGTEHMIGIPYFKPALDRHFTADKYAERMKKYL